MRQVPFPRASLKQRGIVIACLLSLGGCASPMVRWTAPTEAEIRPQTLTYARTYAGAAREAYRAEIASQFNTTNNLGAGLIGLGSLVAALATSHVHRDAILGSTLLGGTAYGIGQWNLRPQRLLIYQAGVEGINCALAAVIPLSMSDAALAELRNGLAGIEAGSITTSKAIGDVGKAMAEVRVASTNPDLKAADEEIGRAHV